MNKSPRREAPDSAARVPGCSLPVQANTGNIGRQSPHFRHYITRLTGSYRAGRRSVGHGRSWNSEQGEVGVNRAAMVFRRMPQPPGTLKAACHFAEPLPTHRFGKPTSRTEPRFRSLRIVGRSLRNAAGGVSDFP